MDTDFMKAIEETDQIEKKSSCQNIDYWRWDRYTKIYYSV